MTKTGHRNQFGIGVYQRWISPRKGFCCAHRVLHTGDSCSEAVKKIIGACGIAAGMPRIRQRFIECREAAAILHQAGSQSEADQDSEMTRWIKKSCACDRKNTCDFCLAFSLVSDCGF